MPPRSIYPFGSLPANLVAFCGVLRREHGFRAGPAEQSDAARALEIIDLHDESSVRDALRPILSRTPGEARTFDAAFTTFFFPGPAGVPQPGLPLTVRELVPDVVAGDAALLERSATAGRSGYSPLEIEAGGEAPWLVPAEPAWRSAAHAFVRRVQLGLSRRWRPGARGRRFDLRRTLRASVQTGGEPLTVRWLKRTKRTPRIVLLIDGSRSMGDYAPTALRMAVALASVTLRLEVFTFSTALQRITTDVRRAAAGERRRLERLSFAWAGGTSIGGCLRDFLRRFGDRMIGRDTLVIVASDGLEVGSVAMLRDVMRELDRRSAGIVWLNPLLDTEGYAPIASGMRAARPHIRTFTSVNTAADLWRLSRMVRLRG
jgi:uncharacterized protein with von Willebrand factor type A (vWA) domain